MMWYISLATLLLTNLSTGHESIAVVHAGTSHMKTRPLPFGGAVQTRWNELWSREQEEDAGIWRKELTAPPSWDALGNVSHVKSFSWCNNDGINYCTMSRNQHLPQYCASSWLFATLSALGDRIDIVRRQHKEIGVQFTLSPQHVLNCGQVGNCWGGSMYGVYQWLSGNGVSYESACPYTACAENSTWGICSGQSWDCTPINIAKTCDYLPTDGGKCFAVSPYPNATVMDYGLITAYNDRGFAEMQLEIMLHGPIACGTDADYLNDYTGGIITDRGVRMNHAISLVGWGDGSTLSFWIGRNSWGEYWGISGFFKAAFGAILIGHECTWAVPGTFTTLRTTTPCTPEGEC